MSEQDQRTRRQGSRSPRSRVATERAYEYFKVKPKLRNDDQPALYARLIAGQPVEPVTGVDTTASVATMTKWEAAKRYFPALLRASTVTILLSCLSMGLAVGIGVLIATGRVYGAPPVRGALLGYVELMRGTPILLQLFVLYYGIAAAVRLPAFVAALLGLALNYAAYESEIYRGALQAVSRGQLEAARTLGFSNMQTTLMLTEAPIEMRSRLMGIVTVGIGTGPLGVLLAGAIAGELGPRGAILVMASLGLAATLALVVVLRRR